MYVCVCVYRYGFLAGSFSMSIRLYFFNIKLTGADSTVPTARTVKGSRFHCPIEPISVLQT